MNGIIAALIANSVSIIIKSNQKASRFSLTRLKKRSFSIPCKTSCIITGKIITGELHFINKQHFKMFNFAEFF